jgi:hypothetical protein
MRTDVTISDLLDEFWRLYFVIIKGIFGVIAAGAHFLIMGCLFLTQRTFSFSVRVRSRLERWTPTTPNVFVLRERSKFSVLECRHAEGQTTRE